MKLTKSYTLFSLFSLLLSCCISYRDGSDIRIYINDLKEKNPVPELNKIQMYADFDTLISIMERCNPQYLLRKKVTGYDMLTEMKAQRIHIENCDNTLDFIKLVKKVTSLSLDPHCSAGGSLVWHYQKSFFKKDIEINEITKEDFGINFHYEHDIFRKYLPMINLIYIQGKYFLKHTTTFFNGEDSVSLPVGTEIVTFNQQPVEDIQNTVRDWYSCWDYQNNRYYHPMLYIINTQNYIGFNLNNDTITEYLFDKFSQIKNNTYKKGYLVKWLEKDSIIYITIPEMQYVKDWLKQLKSELLHYKKKPVQSVIIDIRGNWGGNDQVWEDVLGMVCKTSIEFPSCFITTMDSEVIKRTVPLNIEPIIEKENQKRIFECIDSQFTFRVRTEYMDTIKNHKRNLGYKGVIYILVDEDVYSSAGAFKSLNTKTNRIKTIGMPTGKVLGRGLNPSVFVLPNSRFIFRMELVLDAAGTSKAEDFYHDHIDYKIIPSIEYYKYWHAFDRLYTIDEKAMYEYDEVFIKALEIIKAQQQQE